MIVPRFGSPINSEMHVVRQRFDTEEGEAVLSVICYTEYKCVSERFISFETRRKFIQTFLHHSDITQ